MPSLPLIPQPGWICLREGNPEGLKEILRLSLSSKPPSSPLGQLRVSSRSLCFSFWSWFPSVVLYKATGEIFLKKKSDRITPVYVPLETLWWHPLYSVWDPQCWQGWKGSAWPGLCLQLSVNFQLFSLFIFYSYNWLYLKKAVYPMLPFDNCWTRPSSMEAPLCPSCSLPPSLWQLTF